ncbi:thioredoxin-like protein [Microdochium bolleyi]|uniref:Thioredoxin-like protein n=1 Tax=Microdochium bolleyi TaxID=196109 RepID=A0A136JCC3_9PEZI|nr:thioredoxin-like protein [Microdochium bolleyi]
MAAAAAASKAKGGRIECYVDVASFFSYIAFVQLASIEDTLRQHGVEVDVYPVLIGGINAGSGNKPPWVVPAKAKYLTAHDTRRANLLAGLDPVRTQGPKDLFKAARTMAANRALSYISRTFPREVYRAAMLGLFAKFWTVDAAARDPEEDQARRDLTTPDKVAAALADIPAPTGDGEKKLFTAEQIAQISAAAESGEYKALLKKRTEEALGRGAFGAPWFWVTPAASSDGTAAVSGEPVFGSDRWHVIFDILGLPYTKLALQGTDPAKSKL